MGESVRAEAPSNCEKCGGPCEIERTCEPASVRCLACEHTSEVAILAVAAVPGTWTLVDPHGVTRHFSSWQEIVASLPLSGMVGVVPESASLSRGTRSSSAAALLDVTPAPPSVGHLALFLASPRSIDEPIEVPDEDVMPASSRDASALARAHVPAAALSQPPPLPPAASLRPRAVTAPPPSVTVPPVALTVPPGLAALASSDSHVAVSAPPPAPKGGTLKTLPPSPHAPPPPTIDIASDPDVAAAIAASESSSARMAAAKASSRVVAVARSSDARDAVAPTRPSLAASRSSGAKLPNASDRSTATATATERTEGGRAAPPRLGDELSSPPRTRGWLGPVAGIAAVAAVAAYFMHGASPSADPVPHPATAKEDPQSVAGRASAGASQSTAPPSTTTPPGATTGVAESVMGSAAAHSSSASPKGSAGEVAERRAVGDLQLSLPEVLERAAAARKSGDVAHAKALLERALELSPGNAEANGLLADLARSRGDGAAAKAAYERALATSPSYFPAMLGLADTEWDLGERSAAQRHYRDIIAAGRPAPDRVRERASEAVSAGVAPPSTSSTSATPSSPVAAASTGGAAASSASDHATPPSAAMPPAPATTASPAE